MKAKIVSWEGEMVKPPPSHTFWKSSMKLTDLQFRQFKYKVKRIFDELDGKHLH